MARVRTRKRRNARAMARRVRSRVRANPVRRVRRRKRERMRVIPMAMAPNPIRRRYARRRRNPVSSRRVVRYYARRRNPRMFGQGRTTSEMAYMVLGGLAGMAATKFLPTMFPRFSSTNVGRTLTSLAAAILASVVAGALFKDQRNEYIADSVLFGGLMQTGSVALNAFLPSVARQAGLAGGLGAFAPAQFPVPQNPIQAGSSVPALPTPAVVSPTAQKLASASGIGRAFGSAF